MKTAIIYPTKSPGYGIIGIIYVVYNIRTSIRNYQFRCIIIFDLYMWIFCSPIASDIRLQFFNSGNFRIKAISFEWSCRQWAINYPIVHVPQLLSSKIPPSHTIVDFYMAPSLKIQSNASSA